MHGTHCDNGYTLSEKISTGMGLAAAFDDQKTLVFYALGGTFFIMVVIAAALFNHYRKSRLNWLASIYVGESRGGDVIKRSPIYVMMHCLSGKKSDFSV
jgi:hypothetical protein